MGNVRTSRMILYRYFGDEEPVTPLLCCRKIAQQDDITPEQIEKALRAGNATLGGEWLYKGDVLLYQDAARGKAAGYYVGGDGLRRVNVRTGDGAAVIRDWEKRLERFDGPWR